MAPVEKVEEPPQKEEQVPGLIYPPPEVRNIVDKTASFVSRNGIEFESRVRQNEVNNHKFNFLNPTDPYHVYYQYKVKQFREGKGQEPTVQKTEARPAPKQDTAKIIEQVVIKDPPPNFEFIADPPSIAAFDLDVVKLTAQFVARNGRQFLSTLMNREKSYQFDFLRPQHNLFGYFSKLVEQYTKVLIPPKDLLSKLRKEVEDPNTILEAVKYRVEWARHQERQKRKEEEEAEKERISYAQIDWHDFVVVETVDFQPHELGNLPPPTTPEEVGARVLAQERYVKKIQHPEEEDDAVEMEMDSSDDEADMDIQPMETTDQQPQPAAADGKGEEEEASHAAATEAAAPAGNKGQQPTEDKQPREDPLQEGTSTQKQPQQPIIIKKGYDPKAPKPATSSGQDQYLVSPLTGEKVPDGKVGQHMKVGLLHPEWKEQRAREVEEKRNQDRVYAEGEAVSSSLKHLAERRTDIFGAGNVEMQIGKKIGEEDKKAPEKVVWDGHTASMERVTQKARENIAIEQQIAAMHKSQGLIPDKEKIGPAVPSTIQQQKPPPPKPLQAAPPQPRMPPASAPPPRPPPAAPRPPPPQQPPPVKPTMPLGPGAGGLPLPRPPQQRPPALPVQPAPAPPAPGTMPAPPGTLGGPRLVTPAPPQMVPVMMLPTAPRAPIPHPGVGQMVAPMAPQSYMQPLPPHMGGPPGPRPPLMRPPTLPGGPQPPMDDGAPPAKKAKTEDNLIPEDEFLKKNPGPVTFHVQVPSMADKTDWKLSGQMLTFTLPLTDTVSVIKAKLHEQINMPAGKQKLQLDGMFIKDSNSLAFYNFVRNSTLQLNIKERGGRRK